MQEPVGTTQVANSLTFRLALQARFGTIKGPVASSIVLRAFRNA